MKEAKDSLKNKLIILIFTYTIGTWLGVLFYLLKALKVIQILHWERFPWKKQNLIVVSNHPSLCEPILLPLLFFKDYFFHPFKLSSWSIPDKKNYYDRWYWAWVKPRIIPIERGNKKAEIKAFFAMKKVLESGGRIVFFPEGGRTFRGEEFFYSQKGNKIRVLKEGIGLLIAKTNPTILPIWVEGTEKFLPNSPDPDKLYSTFPKLSEKIIIKIGQPFKTEKENPEKIIQEIVTHLLRLSDE